jgi:dTDP-4-dehydrorhamnose reductase
MIPVILLIGKHGQIGRDLTGLLPAIGSVVAVGRDELNLSDREEIQRVIRSVRPQLIVNAAAYTAVDKAESEAPLASAINGQAPGVIAEEAKKLGALLVHYSTDYVFDGTKISPYTEDDLPNPQSVYGKTKLEGERAIQQSGADHLIFRTAWVYAREGRNFLLTILKLATQREELRIVNDQIGAPTWSHEIASATTRVLEQLSGSNHGSSSLQDLRGIYHMTAGGETNWFQFAEAILIEARRNPLKASKFVGAPEGSPFSVRRLTPISTSEYPTPARRPAYSVLSNSRLMRSFSVQLPEWRAQLISVFADPPVK